MTPPADVSSAVDGAVAADDAAGVPAAPQPKRPVVPEKTGAALRDIALSLMQFIGFAAAAAIAIGAGVLSSRYMISSGALLAADMYGPWQYWRTQGRANADPYTRAHFAKSGELRIASDSAGVFEARADAQGARLHSSCEYVIEGPDPEGLWWSLSVFDERGRLIANDANRYAFTADTIAPNPDGSYIITLGRDAHPGNWLPTGGAGRLVLIFTVLDPATGLTEEVRGERAKFLPIIRREGCS